MTTATLGGIYIYHEFIKEELEEMKKEDRQKAIQEKEKLEAGKPQIQPIVDNAQEQTHSGERCTWVEHWI